MKTYNLLFLVFSLLSGSFCFAEQNGFSYWWLSDGLINSSQAEELDALSDDQELWCALAELYVGRELAEEAECVFEKAQAPKKSGKKKIWNFNLSGGANLDSGGNLKNRFAKAAGKVWDISGEMRLKEGNEIKGTAAFRHGIFHAKGGDLTSKNRGILSEFNLGDLNLGGEWLFKEEKDSSWFFGKFSKNFLEKRIYAGGNFRLIAPYSGGTRLWSRTWQGLRFLGWNLRVTEIAVTKENENTLDFSVFAERKRKGARLVFDRDKNKSGVGAGFKPVLQGTDSLWARSEYPLRMQLGWDKKMQNVRVSNSLLFKENWMLGKPLEFRNESKIKIPLAFSPLLTLRWTAHIYKDERINLRQFYVGIGIQ